MMRGLEPIESTPLVLRRSRNYSCERLCMHSREVWSVIVVVLLFCGKACMPFANEAAHITQAALIDDPDLNLDTMKLAWLFATQSIIGGVSKIAVAFTLRCIGPRNVWLGVLSVGALNLFVIASTKYVGVLFALTMLHSLIYAWIYPATTMAIAGWIDGAYLGRAIGFVATAAKLSPIGMSELYQHLLEKSWRLCYVFAASLFAGAFVVFAVFMRSSAEACGFRSPTPPGARDDAAKPRAPALANEESSIKAISIVLCMRRTWALLGAFVTLVLIKSSVKFATIYAKTRLGVSASEGASLFVWNACAAALAGILGGFLYDIVPGGKMGVGLMMTTLNILNIAGLMFALTIECLDQVSLMSLQIFMAIVGFASVLPVSLPFQIYSMAIGGTRHCGMLVATFECVAMSIESLTDLLTGNLLQLERYTTWLIINLCLSVVGTVCMGIYYYLDYRKSPRANVLTAVPSVNFMTKSSSKLQLWMDSWAADQNSPSRSRGGSRPGSLQGTPTVARRNVPDGRRPSASLDIGSVPADLSGAERALRASPVPGGAGGLLTAPLGPPPGSPKPPQR